MVDRSPASKDAWPWILGGLLRRPWAWLVLLAAVAMLLGGPLMRDDGRGYRPRLEPEVLRLSERVRSLAAVAAVPADEPLSVALYELAGPWDQDTGAWRIPPARVLRRLVESGRNVVALNATGLPSTLENLASLAGLPALERLELSGFVGSETVQLSGLPVGSLLQLRVLNLNGTSVDTERLGFLAGLPLLEVLALPSGRVDETLAAELATFPRLRRVYLNTPREPALAVAALKPLLEAPSLEEVYIDAGAVESPEVVKAVQASLPNLVVRSAMAPSRSMPPWLLPFGAAGVLALLGVQLVLWTSGPLPVTVPGFPAAHRRVAWMLAALCVVAVTSSAWACGVSPWLVGPGVAAFFGGLWWMNVSGTAAALPEGGRGRQRDRWLPLLPFVVLLAVLYLVTQASGVAANAAGGVALGLLATFFLLRMDPWLHGRRRRPTSDRLEAAGGTGSGASPSDPFNAGDDWPVRADDGRGWKRLLASAFVVVVTALLFHPTDADGWHPLLTIAVPAVAGNLAIQPLLWADLRWRRRLATLRAGVPLPGGRTRQVREAFGGMARDHAGFWPVVLATALCVGLMATRRDFGVSAVDGGLLTFSLAGYFVACWHATLCLLWRRRILSGVVLVVAAVAGWACNVFLVIDGQVPAGWSLLAAALAVLLAAAANRLARGRELACEWG